MKISQINNARALYADSEGMWLARGMKYWKANYEGHPIREKFSVGGTIIERIIADFLSTSS